MNPRTPAEYRTPYTTPVGRYKGSPRLVASWRLFSDSLSSSYAVSHMCQQCRRQWEHCQHEWMQLATHKQHFHRQRQHVQHDGRHLQHKWRRTTRIGSTAGINGSKNSTDGSNVCVNGGRPGQLWCGASGTLLPPHPLELWYDAGCQIQAPHIAIKSREVNCKKFRHWSMLYSKSVRTCAQLRSCR